jgi:hypothetical protein
LIVTRGLLALAILVAAVVAAFAIYTFGYRDSSSSGLGRAEKARVASILNTHIAPDSGYYIEDIKRTSRGRYLVMFGNVDHPSVRICALEHIDLARWRRIGKSVQLPCD